MLSYLEAMERLAGMIEDGVSGLLARPYCWRNQQRAVLHVLATHMPNGDYLQTLYGIGVDRLGNPKEWVSYAGESELMDCWEIVSADVVMNGQ